MIRDFADGRDQIDLDDASRAEVSQIIDEARVEDGDTVLSYGQGEIRLSGVMPDQISLDDFVF